MDLSFPFDHSVNDGIDKDEFSLQYCSVKHAIDLTVKTGKGALMGKVDIKSAYRIIPVHPSDRYLLGMRWRDKFYVDLALPFGLRSAPGIFNTVADLFEWILIHHWSVEDLLHYLDDYFTLGRPGPTSVPIGLRLLTRQLNMWAFHLLLKNARALQPELYF